MDDHLVAWAKIFVKDHLADHIIFLFSFTTKIFSHEAFIRPKIVSWENSIYGSKCITLLKLFIHSISTLLW